MDDGVEAFVDGTKTDSVGHDFGDLMSVILHAPLTGGDYRSGPVTEPDVGPTTLDTRRAESSRSSPVSDGCDGKDEGGTGDTGTTGRRERWLRRGARDDTGRERTQRDQDGRKDRHSSAFLILGSRDFPREQVLICD